MNKPFYKNLQNIERNKPLSLVYVSAAEVKKKLYRVKYWNWNLQTQIDKVQWKQHSNVYFGCFLSTSL